LTRATAEDVIELYSALRAERVRLWVDGGWGIDALLGRQTRLHKDFDAVAAFEDLPALTRLLDSCGFALKLIWEENRWAPSSELLALIGRERPAMEAATAFVLEDGLGRELDFHIVVRLDEHGQWVPAWDSDLAFPPEAFAGMGTIGGRRALLVGADADAHPHGLRAQGERHTRLAPTSRPVRHRIPRRGR
jgi:lincosamide nucleotidyltransferase A/C/D/E